MTKRQTTTKDVPRPRVGDAAWRGLTPGQRKGQAERRLREMESEPTQAQVREAERLVLLEEIAEAEREQAESFGAGLEPEIRSGIAEYVLAQRLIAPRFGTALSELGRVVEAAVQAEKVVRLVRDILSRQIEASLALRLEREGQGKTADQILELQRNLTLEGNTQFRRRWSELAASTGAKPLLGEIEPDSDLAREMLQALQREVGRQLGGRPQPFTTRGRTF